MKVFEKDTKKINVDNLKYKFYVFDTETTKLEPMPKNFVFGVVYGYAYVKIIYSVEDFKKEFQKSRYKGKYVFAHNAEFDLTTLYGNIYQNLDTSAIFNGGFILAKKDGVTFADSMNLFAHMSVKKIGEMIGLHKLENIKVSSDSLRQDNISAKDLAYCVRDCKIVYLALQRMFESIGNIKVTLPSLALWDYRHNYLKKSFFINDHVYDFYESYYGGRCEAFRIGKVDADVFDVNSMYPYAMKHTTFPDVKHLKKIEHPNVKTLLKLLKHYEGFAKVKVRHKETHYGYLPCKMEIGKSTKLVFPVGVFETAVNFNELRFALENDVVKILRCDYVVYALPVASPFVKYVDTLYKGKETSTDNLNKLIYKLRMNALYGKFGQKTKYNTEYHADFPLHLILQMEKDNKKYEVKPFNKVRIDCFLITENENVKHGFYSIPSYASYITSAARILLLKHFIMNNPEDLCYCDTDSIFIENKFVGDIGLKLGQFKQESKKVTEIRGLKNYKYINEKGEQRQVLKGVSGNAKEEKINEVGKPERTIYHVRKYYKTLQSLRQNKETGESYEQLKEIVSPYDKRIILEDGHTKPIKL